MYYNFSQFFSSRFFFSSLFFFFFFFFSMKRRKSESSLDKKSFKSSSGQLFVPRKLHSVVRQRTATNQVTSNPPLPPHFPLSTASRPPPPFVDRKWNGCFALNLLRDREFLRSPISPYFAFIIVISIHHPMPRPIFHPPPPR